MLPRTEYPYLFERRSISRGYKMQFTEKSEEFVAFCMRKAMIEKWKYMRKISKLAESFSKWI